MAIMAFMCLLIVFFMHKAICAPSIDEINAAISGDKSLLKNQNSDIDPEDVILDPSEIRRMRE